MALKKVLTSAAAAASFAAISTAPAFAGGPVVVKQFAPDYPRAAERRDLEGTVDLSFNVDDNGKVQNVEVIGATMPGVFDSAAVKALEKWKFEKGAPGAAEVTIVFDLG